MLTLHEPARTFHVSTPSSSNSPSAGSDPQGRDTASTGRPNGSHRAKRIFTWVVIVAALLFFASVLRESLDPFGDAPYLEISHGDHVHYVPRDRDPRVSISNFPTQQPGPNEMITPEGRIVERE